MQSDIMEPISLIQDVLLWWTHGSYGEQDIRSSLTVKGGRRYGQEVEASLRSFVRPKCHALFFDPDINSPSTVFLNIYQIFLLCWMKMHGYLSEMYGVPRLSPRFLSSLLFRTIRYTHTLICTRLRGIPKDFGGAQNKTRARPRDESEVARPGEDPKEALARRPTSLHDGNAKAGEPSDPSPPKSNFAMCDAPAMTTEIKLDGQRRGQPLQAAEGESFFGKFCAGGLEGEVHVESVPQGWENGELGEAKGEGGGACGSKEGKWEMRRGPSAAGKAFLSLVQVEWLGLRAFERVMGCKRGCYGGILRHVAREMGRPRFREVCKCEALLLAVRGERSSMFDNIIY